MPWEPVSARQSVGILLATCTGILNLWLWSTFTGMDDPGSMKLGESWFKLWSWLVRERVAALRYLWNLIEKGSMPVFSSCWCMSSWFRLLSWEKVWAGQNDESTKSVSIKRTWFGRSLGEITEVVSLFRYWIVSVDTKQLVAVGAVTTCLVWSSYLSSLSERFVCLKFSEGSGGGGLVSFPKSVGSGRTVESFGGGDSYNFYQSGQVVYNENKPWNGTSLSVLESNCP